jgi:hypothetical protein
MSALKSIVASYFEGVIAGSFKTAADGQRLFYPWGVTARATFSPTPRLNSVSVSR